MDQNATLKQHLTIVPSADGSWLIYGGEGELWRLRARDENRRMLRFLLPLLNDRHSAEDIAAAAQRNGIAVADVAQCLAKLDQAGVMMEPLPVNGGLDREAPGPEEQRIYFSRIPDAKGSAVQESLRAAMVDVLVRGQLGISIATVLRGSGIGTVRLLGRDPDALKERIETGALSTGPGGTRLETLALSESSIYPDDQLLARILVVPLEAWEPALTETVNEFALEHEIPWLLVQAPGVREGTIGPLFVPGRTGCYMCLDARLRSNMSFHAEYEEVCEHLRSRRIAGPPWGGLRAQFEIMAGFAALEIVKYLSEIATPGLAGRFLSIDWSNLKTRRHEVLRLPRCVHCRPPRMESFPWEAVPVEED